MQQLNSHQKAHNKKPKLNIKYAFGDLSFPENAFRAAWSEAAASFQHVMGKALREVRDCVVPYTDDILGFSTSWKKHLEHLCQVFSALGVVGLIANQNKSHLGRQTVLWIGQGQLFGSRPGCIPKRASTIHQTG